MQPSPYRSTRPPTTHATWKVRAICGLILLFLNALPSPASSADTTATPKSPGAGPEILDRNLFIDSQGLIVHYYQGTWRDTAGNKDVSCKPETMQDHIECQDGGDTAQREGWFWLAEVICRQQPTLRCKLPKRSITFEKVLEALQPKHRAEFVRNGDPGFNVGHADWNQTLGHGGFTRDQMTPLIAAMGLQGHYRSLLLDLWTALPVDRLGKHSFNGDWVSASDFCDALPPTKAGEEGNGFSPEKCKAILGWHPAGTPSPVPANMPKLPAQNCTAIQKINCDPLPKCSGISGEINCKTPFSAASCPLINTSCPAPIKADECPLTTIDTELPPTPGLCPGPAITAQHTGPTIKVTVPGPRVPGPPIPGVCGKYPPYPCFKAGPSVQGPPVTVLVPGPPVNVSVPGPPIPCMKPSPPLHTTQCITPACLACQGRNTEVEATNAINAAQCGATQAIAKGACSAMQVAQAARCLPAGVTRISSQVLCEATKAPLVDSCKATRLLADSECTLRNIFSGDILQPQDVNLFRASLGGDPTLLNGDIPLPEISPPQAFGEQALGINVISRIGAAKDKDNVDDLNLIVMLLRTDGVRGYA